MYLPLETACIEAGRRLGHDLYVHRSRTDLGLLPASVREGFDEAAARHATRADADRFVRKWLQLRSQALLRLRVFDERVTPEILRRIDVAECPVTRTTLTHGTLTDSDWSVDRLNNEGGYAVNNLAVMSVLANRAKGAKSFDEVRSRAGLDRATDGLDPVQWLRMAAMMLGPCFAIAPQHAPLLPHAVPVSPHRLLLASQQIQHAWCTQAGTQAGKNRLIKSFKPAARDESGMNRLRELAECVHRELKRSQQPCDIWLCPDVMQALCAWRECLDDSGWASVAQASSRLSGARKVEANRLRSWQMSTRGFFASGRQEASC